MDHYVLLKKYMRLVLIEEGVTFVNRADKDMFNPEEQQELKRLDALLEEWK